MKTFTVQFTEIVAHVTTIEAETAEEAAEKGKEMVKNDVFPTDTPERIGGQVTAFIDDEEPAVVELD